MLGTVRRRHRLARWSVPAAVCLAVLVDGTGDAAGLAPRAGSSAGAPAATPAGRSVATSGAAVGVAPRISLGPGGLVAFPDAASQWVAAHPRNRWTPSIKSRITGRPSALWLTGNESFGNLNAAVHLAAARRGTLTLTLWNIPLRYDGLSGLSKVTVSQYETWVDTIAARLHATRAIIVLEPDALWFYDRMPDAASKAQRVAAMRYAVDTLRAKAPYTRVYIDAGTSSGSVTPARMAELLRRGGLGRLRGQCQLVLTERADPGLRAPHPGEPSARRVPRPALRDRHRPQRCPLVEP